MFHVALYQPEIPPNTGNIIRLCANTGARLHVIHPLGFELDDAKLRRAGLDYHEFADLQEHRDFENFEAQLGTNRLFGISTKGGRVYTDVAFQDGDVFLFGPETRGLPSALLDRLPCENVLRIPMLPRNRSLNLSNAAAVIVFEAWRQIGFKNGA